MAPGPAAAWLETSSSSDASTSSTPGSKSPKDTVRNKMKKVLRSRRRRKTSIASTDTVDTADTHSFRAGVQGTGDIMPRDENGSQGSSSRPQKPSRKVSTDKQDETTDDEKQSRLGKKFSSKRRRYRKKGKKNQRPDSPELQPTIRERPEPQVEANGLGIGEHETRRIDFATVRNSPAAAGGIFPTSHSAPLHSVKRPFPNLRGISVKNVKNLTPAVFANSPQLGAPTPPQRPTNVPRVRYGIRRTNSLPDQLNLQQQQQQQQQQLQYQFRPPGAMLPLHISARTLVGSMDQTAQSDGLREDEWQLSRTGAIVLLLLSTALVAVCAEFLIDSIDEVVATSSVGQIFIGLIILPIVGNAAEHVTALTVAMKNKMDLAIGVAVGSSIQIAIFVTPLVVILGWILDKDMSLYFTLFETVCLFVSAFMVNFLVLDGRSNYLEGALLCAVYIIISIVAFFYPQPSDASQWG